MLDFAKSKGITFLGTSLLGQGSGDIELSASHVSTIADTWLHLSYLIQNGERNRALTVVKSRGTAHSNQVRELVLSRDGLDLIDVYANAGGVLLGSARVERQQKEERDRKLDDVRFAHRKFELACNIEELKAQVQALNHALASKQQEAELEQITEKIRIDSLKSDAALRMELRRTSDDRLADRRTPRKKTKPTGSKR
jgi:circadian clock protein KaiC